MKKFAGGIIMALGVAEPAMSQYQRSAPEVKGHTIVISAPAEVSKSFSEAISKCIGRDTNNRMMSMDEKKEVTCNVGGNPIRENEVRFLKEQGYSIISKTQNNASITLRLDEYTIRTNHIRVPGMNTTSTPDLLPSVVPKCSSLMPPNTSIQSNGHVIIGSIITDGYKGSMINGVKCN